ncbi:hypothetical protein F4780DRAFT_386308 [Xylariomycetidae sp. FL0641]|nr:hypothetical protein F4780DRAFT_386308 [Xylariomycetidae sp. FL0641]
MSDSKRSPTPSSVEDPDTAAARKELRQTVISDKPDLSAMPASTTPADLAPTSAAALDKASDPGASFNQPTLEPPYDPVKDQMASPKKKRARDDVEEPKDGGAAGPNGDVSPLGDHGAPSLDRTNRSEPEKKRPRDVSSETKTGAEAPTTSSKPAGTTQTSDRAAESEEKKDTEPQVEMPAETASDKASEKTIEQKTEQNKKSTSSSAFNSSGLAGFATQASPFLQAGTTAQPLSSFASAPSPFAAAAASKPSVFGSSSLSNGSSSPFGQVTGAPKPFGGSAFGGSAFGSTFGNNTGGSTLTGFGKTGDAFKGSKPAKPFGAPASEAEESDEEQEEVSASDNDKDKNENAGKDGEDEKSGTDEKKKTKLQRVEVDTGEANEATILQVRAKIYNLDKASNSWKERGAGNLKINVPLACVDIDEDTGSFDASSFDVSGLEKAESKIVRLVMRQDATHKIILNTVVIPTMQFQEKSTVKATCVLFTAIEDEGAVSIQMKVMCLWA